MDIHCLESSLVPVIRIHPNTLYMHRIIIFCNCNNNKLPLGVLRAKSHPADDDQQKEWPLSAESEGKKIEQQGRFKPIVSVLASNWLLLSSRSEETGIITSLKYSFLVTCTRQSISYLKKYTFFLFSVYIVKQISLETFYFPFQQWASFTYGIIRDVLEFQSLKWLKSTCIYKFYFLTLSLRIAN